MNGVRAMRISFAFPALLLVFCTSCTTTGELSDCVFCTKRTYRVLDSMTEQQIPGVEITLSKVTTIPGPGSPGLLSYKSESLKSDDQGTFVAPEGASISMRKNGYEQVRVAQSLHADHESGTLYLTKKEDLNVAEYEFRLEHARLELTRLSALSRPVRIEDQIDYELLISLISLPTPDTKREKESKDRFCSIVASTVEEIVARIPDPCAECEAIRQKKRDFSEKCLAVK